MSHVEATGSDRGPRSRRISMMSELLATSDSFPAT